MRTASQLNFKLDQIEKFRKVSHNFDYLYSNTKNLVVPQWVQPFWLQTCNALASRWSDAIPSNFLSDPLIAQTMSSTNTGWARDQLKILIDKEAWNTKYLEEQAPGDPYIFDEDLMCSCNTIHHLYHYNQYERHVPDKKVNTIVEFGCGYGRLPILFSQLLQPKTYIMIDLPVFSILQYFYLTCSTDFHVNLLTSPGLKIKEGAVNIVPIGLVPELDMNNISCDLFVAMWSLSETTRHCCDDIYNKFIKSSPGVMIALHANEDTNLPCGNYLFNLLKDECLNIPFGYVPNHHYLVR